MSGPHQARGHSAVTSGTACSLPHALLLQRTPSGQSIYEAEKQKKQHCPLHISLCCKAYMLEPTGIKIRCPGEKHVVSFLLGKFENSLLKKRCRSKNGLTHSCGQNTHSPPQTFRGRYWQWVIGLLTWWFAWAGGVHELVTGTCCPGLLSLGWNLSQNVTLSEEQNVKL